MPAFLKIPKVQLALILLLIYLSALKQYPTLSNLYLAFICVGFTIFFDLLFTYIRRRVLFLPLSALVTGLIIALVVDPNALWYQLAFICAVAVAAKNFVRLSGKHIFNPAGAGLFLGAVIFNVPISWWGASLLPFYILLLPGLISALQLRRFGSVLSFLLIYSLSSTFSLLTDPTTIFFALVMLPEPMTSPFDLKKQVFYGVIVAAFTLVFSQLPIFPDALIPALLLGNVFNFFFK